MIHFLPFICTSVHGHRVVGTNIDCVLCVLLFACLFVCLFVCFVLYVSSFHIIGVSFSCMFP